MLPAGATAAVAQPARDAATRRPQAWARRWRHNPPAANRRRTRRWLVSRGTSRKSPRGSCARRSRAVQATQTPAASPLVSRRSAAPASRQRQVAAPDQRRGLQTTPSRAPCRAASTTPPRAAHVPVASGGGRTDHSKLGHLWTTRPPVFGKKSRSPRTAGMLDLSGFGAKRHDRAAEAAPGCCHVGLGCAGLRWAALGCAGLRWAALGWSARRCADGRQIYP